MTKLPAIPTGGRPRKWQDAKAVQAVADSYFEGLVRAEKPPTVAGLALALDLDRRTLQRYMAGEGEDNICRVIKRAKMQIEQAHEERLFGTSPTGSIFWLKNNAGYADAQQVTHSGPNGGPITLAAVRTMTDEELSARVAQLEGGGHVER